VRRALKRGVTLTDAGTKAAVAEQLQIGEALRRKIEGRKGGSDSDDEGGTGSDGSDSGTGSDGEMGESDGKATEAGGAGRRGSRRMRSAALEILAGG
jgi:U3 small nucleolar RNA-associated protein 14